MKHARYLILGLIVLVAAAPAMATHWDAFEGSADCDGWCMTGTIVVGNLGITGHVDYTVTLMQGAVTVEEHTGTIGFDATGPSDFNDCGTWDTELCGDFTATGTYTIVGADDLSGDGVRVFESSFTCECGGGDVCHYTPGYWKNHVDVWPMTDFELGGVMYTQAQLLDIMNTPVRGDATIILAYHLIAAKLNVANGADDSIQGTIDDADAYLAAHPIGSFPTGADKAEGIAIKDDLAAYNELECGPFDGSLSKSLPNSEQSTSWSDLKAIYR